MRIIQGLTSVGTPDEALSFEQAKARRTISYLLGQTAKGHSPTSPGPSPGPSPGTPQLNRSFSGRDRDHRDHRDRRGDGQLSSAVAGPESNPVSSRDGDMSGRRTRLINK